MPSRLRLVQLLSSLCIVSIVTLSSHAADKAKGTPAADVPAWEAPQPAVEKLDLNMYMRIREEGLQHSHIMEYASALADGIGPRLTGSPNLAKANAWTRDQLTKMGRVNAHLEDWGEFGLGWQQLNTWARLVVPDTAMLIVQATPWSPATPGPVTGDVVFVSITDDKDFDKMFVESVPLKVSDAAFAHCGAG